jgi:hypothetical protein
MNNEALRASVLLLAGRMLPIVGAMLLEALQRKLQESVPASEYPPPNLTGGRKSAPRRRKGSLPPSESRKSHELGNQQLP